MRKWIFVAGVAVGYVLGARAGRQRYDQIVDATRKVQANPTVQNLAGLLQDQVEKVSGKCRDRFAETGIGARLLREEVSRAKHTNPVPERWETAGTAPSSRGNPGRNGVSGY